MTTKSLKPTASIFKAGSHLTFVLSNKSYSITRDDAHFARAVAAYAKGDWDTVLSFVDRPQYVTKWSEGRVKVVDGAVLFDDAPISGYLVDRILDFVDKNLPIGPIVRFLEDLQNARNEHVKQDLYLFLEKNDLPLTEDGGFLAYKLTNADGTPYYHAAADVVYQVGKLMEMPYESCDSSRDECGGVSWYAARKDYWSDSMFDAKGDFIGSGKLFLVKIMPSWVVSVPVSEDGKKLKCFKMLPIMEYSRGAKRQEAHVKEVEAKVWSLDYPEDSLLGVGHGASFDDMLDLESQLDAKPVPKRAKNGRFIPKSVATICPTHNVKPKRDAKGHFVASKKVTKTSYVKGRVRKVNAKGHVVGGKNYRGANGRFV